MRFTRLQLVSSGDHGAGITRTLLVACAGARGLRYLVVDINYFPGYEKLPFYEDLMVSFLEALRSGRLKGFDMPIRLVQD